jgi:hypothetical protein
MFVPGQVGEYLNQFKRIIPKNAVVYLIYCMRPIKEIWTVPEGAYALACLRHLQAT